MSCIPKRPSAADTALKIAAQSDGSFSAKDVVVLCGCSSIAAQVALSNLTAAGKLTRVARGFYARPGVFPDNTSTAAGPTTMARGINDAANRALAEAEAFLADCPPLPRNRPPVFDAPRARRCV